MGIIRQNNNGKGSLKDIQLLVNNSNKHIINEEIAKKLCNIDSHKVEWLSPKKNKEYAEYRDQDFLDLLEINPTKLSLKEFWPSRGPQWDALGLCEDSYFLVEAKANIGELVTPACSATSEKSIKLINKSLRATQKLIAPDSKVDWSGKYYQYTNRLAHLYYLREINELDAYMVFVYFVGDKSVGGPDKKVEWDKAIDKMYKKIDLKKENKLSKYVIDVFIDVNDLKF